MERVIFTVFHTLILFLNRWDQRFFNCIGYSGPTRGTTNTRCIIFHKIRNKQTKQNKKKQFILLDKNKKIKIRNGNGPTDRRGNILAHAQNTESTDNYITMDPTKL